jgi:hypothetical protein
MLQGPRAMYLSRIPANETDIVTSLAMLHCHNIAIQVFQTLDIGKQYSVKMLSGPKQHGNV